MNTTSLVIGVALIAYGLFTLYARARRPRWFWKLQPMRDNLGDKAGTAAHIFFYSVVPIILGVIAIVAGFQGIQFLG
jgi:hypothetical protein